MFHWLAQLDVADRWSRRMPPWLAQALFGLSCTGAAAGVRLVLDLFMPAGQYALVYPAVLISTLFGRWRAGVWTYVICFILVWRVVLPHTGPGFGLAPDEASRLAVNCLTVLVILIFAEIFRAAIRSALDERDTALAAVAEREAGLRELNNDLERRVAERVADLGQTWKLNPDIMGVLNTDGFFEKTNPAWQTILGWPRETIETTKFFDLIHPDDLPRTYEAWDQVNQGRPVLRFENRYKHQEGGWRWLSWVVVPEDGKFYGSARDITADKDREAELAHRTAERDRIWRNSRDVITVIDLGGTLISVNPAATEVLGWSEDEMVGRWVLDLIHPDDWPELNDGQMIAERYDAPRIINNRCEHKDGHYRHMSWLSARSEDGLIYSSGRDVTAEKEQAEALRIAEDNLRQSQKMEAVGQLTGGIAHDFNNLLMGVSGSLELIQARIGQNRATDALRYVTAAQAAAQRAASLTHRLLAFSRRQTLDPQALNVNRLIGDIEDMIRRTIGPRIELEVIGAGGLWSTRVDANQLENAILNLCINARDAMPDGGRITIETANKWLDERAAKERDLPPGQYLSLCVTDTGAGMAPEVAAQAFEPFFTTKPLGAGTGLGLSMIYGFARQSGGQVRLYSEVGQGTTMCIYLPRHLGDAATAEAPVAERAPAPARDGETVLVVDDEPTVRMLIMEVLAEGGFEALEAQDGAAGLAILRSDARIDLLITDVGLPGGMNGRQMADAARVGRPDLKVLFITGYAENAVVGNGHLDAGMAILTKPFVMDALAEKIREMIAAG
jgi:PAS domain S-box-containing protein